MGKQGGRGKGQGISRARANESKPEPFVPVEKDRVYLSYDPDQCGTIVRAGPEQSEVKFDGSPRRETQYIPNRSLRKINT